MKKALLLCSVLLSASSIFSAQARPGGDDIGNGGGIAEKNFLIALSSLESYSNICLELDACRLDLSEKKVLSDIIKAMPEERKVAELLQFVSGKAQPGFFVINGEMKVAKTGSVIGTPIYLNTDLIYFQNSFGTTEAVSIPMALGILLHELGHHVSVQTHAQLDSMGVKVAQFLQNRIQTTPALPWTQAIMATVVHSPQVHSFPQILLNVGDSVVDISHAFKEATNCPKFIVPIPLLPFPDIELGHERPLGSLYHNVHWEKSSRIGENGRFIIVGSISNTCDSGDQDHLLAINSFVMRIYFAVQRGHHQKLELVRGSVEVEQSYEPWYKFIQLPR
jgi:hypothetical protein